MDDPQLARVGAPAPAPASDDTIPGAARPAARPPAVLRVASWFGLMGGLFELGVRLGQNSLSPHVTIDSIRTNRHYTWMIPVSDAALLAALGLVAALAARRWPRAAFRVTACAGAGLAVLGALLAVRGLHGVACVVLACGAGYQIGALVAARRDGFLRVVRWSLPALAGGVLVLAAVQGYRVATAERRALRSLPQATPGAPNVVLLVLDTVRADHLSLYGYGRETSPALARLAARAVRFDQARSTAPWTLPSHASLFTGRWPHQLSTTVSRPLDDEAPTLAEYLARQGYATAGFVGNTYYCNAWYGIDRGFARYEDFPENEVVNPVEILRSARLGDRLVRALGYKVAVPGNKRWRKTAAQINARALEWVDRRPEGRPFFVFLNYYDAHDPFDPPDDYQRRFGLSARDATFRHTLMSAFRHIGKGPNGVPQNTPEAARVTNDAAQLMSDSYDDCIRSLDDQIGRLFENLERRGLLDNTLVVITSDHGEHLGDRHLFGHGMSLYRPLVHVPLLVIPPRGAPAGLVVNEPVSLRDVPATVVDLLDLARRSPFPGTSLARLWAPGTETATGPSGPVLSAVEQQTIIPPHPLIPASLGPLWSLADREHVYIRQSQGREELYDLDDDPAETEDISAAAENRPVLERFRASLGRLLGDTGDATVTR